MALLFSTQMPAEAQEQAKKWLVSLHWEAVFSFDLGYGAEEDGLYSQVIEAKDFTR